MPSKVFVALWSRPTDTADHVKATVDSSLKALSEAVAEAAATFARQPQEDYAGAVQAIFVAPEYLFTRTRDEVEDDRALSIKETNTVLERLVALSKENPTMLLVPGTVIYKYKAEKYKGRGGDGVAGARADVGALRDKVAKKSAPLRDLAPSDSARGVPSIAQKYDALEKMDGSVTYFTRNRMHVLLNGKVEVRYSKMADMQEVPSKVEGVYIPGQECGRKEIGAYKFGFEICYDHDVGVLKKLDATPAVDFHVIASASVENNIGAMVAARKRFVLHACSRRENTTVHYYPMRGVPLDVRSTKPADVNDFKDVVASVAPGRQPEGGPLDCWALTLT